VAGAIGGIVSGRFADAFPGRLTRIIAVLYAGATVCVLIFSLICVGVLPFSLPAVYVLTVGAGL
jgi:phosphomevalonate kinase